MVEIKFEIDGIMPAISKILDGLDDGMEEIAEYALEHSQQERDGWPGSRGVPTDRGMLKGSGHVKRNSEMNYSLLYEEPYAADVEYGSGPRPDVTASDLVGWVHRKLDIPLTEKGKGKAWGIAANLARRIQQKGTVPQPYVKPAFDAVVEEAPRILVNSVSRRIERA